MHRTAVPPRPPLPPTWQHWRRALELYTSSPLWLRRRDPAGWRAWSVRQAERELAREGRR